MDIYVYSGRGNSLDTAMRLAERFPDTTMRSIAKAARGPEIALGQDSVIVLVFPTIDMGLPLAVRRLIRKLESGGGSPMVFAAATTGGMPGAILRQAARLLRRRGLPLSAGVHLPYSLRPEDAAIRESRLDELCGAIRARRADAAASGSLVDRLVLTGIGNSLARLLIPKEDRSFEAGASCEGCGTCARLCPAGNIELEDGKPRWKGHCEQCGACFAWCGRAAIAGKCLAARTRYTNPGVSLSEMLDLAEDRLRPQNPMLRSSATKEA